jgi:4-aminobutyrate aminotransferase-like enzyme/Ser/Thr protein kinase RdoA (MazF antagonist)
MVFDFRNHTALPRPVVTIDDARRIATGRYGLTGDGVELGSNQDRNFRFGGAVLKIANAVFGDDELAAQNAAADAVLAAGLRAPRCVPDADGERIGVAELPGGPYRVRLLEFVEGEPLTGSGAFTAQTARDLGALAARVALALRGLEHPGATQVTQWNLRIAGEVIELLAPQIADPQRRGRVLATAVDALAVLDPVRDRLRSQVIHGDLTDDNAVIGPGGTPDGVIDFGDVAESWTVAELAVTAASVLHHNPRDPLVVLDTIAAFHELLPLASDELDALWPLVQLRAAVLVASGEHQVALEADNAYAAENRRHEWRAFVTATELDAAAMRALIGWRLGARSAPFAVEAPARLLLDATTATRLDLSTTSPALDGGAWLDEAIEARLAAAAGDSVTTWAQPRLTRAVPRSSHEVATLPLGVDVTMSFPVEITAPVAGASRVAGDALVLDTGEFELWLTGLTVTGEPGVVAAGDALGTATALHVQVSRSPGIRPPAFVRPSEGAVWRQVCPDPSVLLGLEPVPEAETSDALLQSRDASFATVQEHYYAHPPRIERGWREHFVDTDGQTYLDMVNNVATTGHGHPRLVDAVSRQWALLNTNSRFHYGVVAEFSKRLAGLAPDGLDTVFLVNSGSEAVDLALRLATTATGRPTVLAMREAYHGWTIGSDAVSSSIGDNPRALETRPGWVRLIDPPYRVDAAASLASLDAALDDDAAGFIAEAIFGNGGGVLLPDGYLAEAYARVRAAGALCIADEVQVGYGRLGEWFWGFEQQGAVPDIITIAKAMGNGHPLGAVITTRAIADAFAAEGSMFSSAGGSPVSCVVGMAVLDIMEDEHLVENARVVGGALRDGLLALAERHELIGAVHGRGLYLGIELARAGVPATAEATQVCDALLREGVIVQPTGDHKNVLKIKPPLLLSAESARFFLDALDRVLGELPTGTA